MSTPKLSNKEIVQTLKEVLAAMEVKGYNFFKIRAYQNAIAILDNTTSSIYDIWENGNLDDIPGIGENLTSHLNELFKTGAVKEWKSVRDGLPDGMFGLLGIRGIGAKKAFKLALAFKLVNRATAAEEIKKLAQAGKIRILAGFGEKSEKDILEAIEQSKFHKREKERMLLIKAEEIVDRIAEYMQKLDCITHIEAAGSFRRRNATVGDLDIPVATTDQKRTMEHFLKFSEIGDVLVKGDKRASVVLKNDVQVDLYVCDPKAYGAMLQYFTGSKQHNILLRTYSLEKNLSLSEYGIKNKNTDKLEEFSNEKDFYEYMGLPLIPPEIREGSNEIELAIKHKLPHLVELKDIKGDLHIHTNYSQDGVSSLEQVAKVCSDLGYEYIGIADHAPSMQTHGHSGLVKIMDDREAEFERVRKKYPHMKILCGYEVSILSDAKLALPNDLLKKLDFVVASIHTAFNQDKATTTKRLISAIENEFVSIIGHPTGRLINERAACDIDWNRVFDAARSHNKILEINAHPQRLDLTYDLVKTAKEWGVKFIINTDSHDVFQLTFMKYGIDVARRGWCEAGDIINTLSYNNFVKSL